MGSYLSSVLGDKPPSNINVDLGTECQPPEGDTAALALFTEASELLKSRPGAALDALLAYKGCEDLIRVAMSAPRDEAKQVQAFRGMVPNVRTIKLFYDLSQDLQQLTSRLVQHLASSDDLAAQQALLRQLADILNFALRFDQNKMVCPAIQNDFSFYRRVLNKAPAGQAPVTDEQANVISMYLAQATPMMTALGNALSQANANAPQVTELLANVANMCCSMMMRNKQAPPTIKKFALTTMVVAMVLYDHANSLGVFRKGGPVNVRKCVTQLKALPAAERSPLLSTLKFSTRTYRQAPQSVHTLITKAESA